MFNIIIMMIGSSYTEAGSEVNAVIVTEANYDPGLQDPEVDDTSNILSQQRAILKPAFKG